MTQVQHTQNGHLLNDGLDKLFSPSREVRDDFNAYLDDVYRPTSAKKRSAASDRSGAIDQNRLIEEDQRAPAENDRERTPVAEDRPDTEAPAPDHPESAPGDAPRKDGPGETEGENPPPTSSQGASDTPVEKTGPIAQPAITMEKTILSTLVETQTNTAAPLRTPLAINPNVAAPLETPSGQVQLQTTPDAGNPGPGPKPLEKAPETIDDNKVTSQIAVGPEENIGQKPTMAEALNSIPTGGPDSDIHSQSSLSSRQENSRYADSRSRSRQTPESEEPTPIAKSAPPPVNEIQKSLQTSGEVVPTDPGKPVAIEKSSGATEILALDKKPVPDANRGAENSERIIKAARAAISRGTSRIQIRLEPPELGALRIDIRQGSSGLHLQLQATNVRAHQMLEQNIVQLRSALESQGMGSAQIDIQLRMDLRNDSTPDQPSNSPQNQQHASQSRQEQRHEFRSAFEDQQFGADPTDPSEEQETELRANQADMEIGSDPAHPHRWQETEFVSVDLTV